MMKQTDQARITGGVFNIQRFSLHDGPGIRTLAFLKGCPLRCPWCSNPEGMVAANQVKTDRRKCRRCGVCRACPHRAVEERDNYYITNPRMCIGCGICIRGCRYHAREATGRTMTAGEVVAECARDTHFYKEGNGGLTLGGGEPLFQPEFALAILGLAKEAGMHTAIETTAFAPPEIFMAAARLCDTIHIDIKMLDPAQHKRVTGVDNEVILGNILRLDECGRDTALELVFRVPVVPGYTHDAGVLRGIGDWLLRLKRKDFRVELLPFHNLGEHKYQQIGLGYSLHGSPNLKPEEVEPHVAMLRDMGLAARIRSF